MNMRKVGIIGVGHVGAHVALSLAMQGICDEIQLCDIDKEKIVSEQQDLLDAVCYLPHRVRVTLGKYEELADCDIIVSSVGKIDVVTKNRLSELQQSVDMIRTFVPRLRKAGFQGIYLNITNPCDIISNQIQKESGLPAARVIGTGTGLDTSRLKAVLARETGFDHKSITTYMLGEHGDSQMAAWSVTAFGGKPLAQLEEEEPERFVFDKEVLAEEVRKAGWKTLNGKGATEFGIASTAARMISCIFHDEKQIFPASTYLNGEYGEAGLYASVPVVLGKDGVDEIIKLNLDDKEMGEFQKTCSVMKEHIALIK